MQHASISYMQILSYRYACFQCSGIVCICSIMQRYARNPTSCYFTLLFRWCYIIHRSCSCVSCLVHDTPPFRGGTLHIITGCIIHEAISHPSLPTRDSQVSSQHHYTSRLRSRLLPVIIIVAIIIFLITDIVFALRPAAAAAMAVFTVAAAVVFFVVFVFAAAVFVAAVIFVAAFCGLC